MKNFLTCLLFLVGGLLVLPPRGVAQPGRFAPLSPTQRPGLPAAGPRGLRLGIPDWHELRMAAGRPAPAHHRAASRASAPLAAPAGAVQPLTASSTLTEQWVARYSSAASTFFESATALAVDEAGNVYVTGYAYDLASNKADYATVKYSPSGQELWVARYNGLGTFSSDDYARALAVDAAGNVYVTGLSEGSRENDFDYATVKYSPTGQQLWAARYNGPGTLYSIEDARALAVDAAGNVYVTGDSSGSGEETDYATVKYSASGQELWVARYNGPANRYAYARALALDASGNVYVTGASYDSGSIPDYATVKYAPNGQELWAARYNGPVNGHDWANALAVDAAGNAYVTGVSDGSSGTQDYATVKYGPSGQELWAARYNGPTNQGDFATALGVDAAGNVYVTGTTDSTFDYDVINTDYATIKYSPTGEQAWVARYNGPANLFDDAKALALDAAGNVYVTGVSDGGGLNSAYATVKYAPSGEELWATRYDGPANKEDGASALAVDAAGNVYVTGYSTGVGSGFDYATIKYSQSVSEPPPACNPTANQPVASADRLSVSAGPLTFTPAQLLANDRDPLGRTLQVASVSQPSAGSLVRHADGSFTYTPWPGFAGPVTFTYRVQEAGPVLASPGTGHYYEFVSAPGLCWAEAKAAASARRYQGMTGYLATVTSAAEQDLLAGRAQGPYWFGAADDEVEGEWRWKTGPEAGQLFWRGGADGAGPGYSHWQPGEPNDYKNEWRPAGEDYGLLNGSSGGWNDVDNCNPGGSTAGYVVEYGGLEACLPVLYATGTVTLEVGSSSQAQLASALSASPAPAGDALLQAAPNPSAGQFRVQVVAGREGPTQLDLFDGQGRRVRALFTGEMQAGESREVPVDAQGVSPGLYLVRLQSPHHVQQLRVLIQP